MARKKSSDLPTSLLWGSFAEIALGANIFTWMTSPSARATAALSVPVSLVVAGISMLVVVLAVIAVAAPHGRSLYGRALGVLLALLAGFVLVVGIVGFAAPLNGAAIGGALVTALGAAGMVVVATKLLRRRRSPA